MQALRTSGFRRLAAGFLAMGLIAACAGLARAQSRPAGVPEAGQSERIDTILKRGTLKVGVTPAFPWVFRNKTGKGDEYRGSS